jgi:Fe-S cluster assembly ATPase SufC
LLKLKRLQILGFKSFCDRTDLKFQGDGIAAIIGPNGCGKSNIADAISWVLGEQSAKTLRGSRMEDVIFAGTRDRKPTGMAEVSLTLIDPEECPGPDADATFRKNCRLALKPCDAPPMIGTKLPSAPTPPKKPSAPWNTLSPARPKK